MIDFPEAKKLILDQTIELSKELIHIDHTAGRVLAEDIFADRHYPPFNRSAVDGYALKSDQFSTEEFFKVIDELHAGSQFEGIIKDKEVIKIMTGAPVPPSLDAVIKVEDSVRQNGHVKFSSLSIRTWMNIAREGEDSQSGEIVIKKNTRIDNRIAAILAAMGKSEVSVYKLPTVSIIATGNEIKAIDQHPKPWEIRDSNSYSIEGFLQSFKISSITKYIVSDDVNELKNVLLMAKNSDILFFSGGVSMGDADFVPGVLKEMGISEIFHKASIRPGKPIWFGTNEKNVVFALPGNPFSVQAGLKIFVEPFLRKILKLDQQQTLKIRIASVRKKKVNLDEFFQCRVNADSRLEMVRTNGSGDIFSGAYSHGIALHPKDAGDLLEGDEVEFYFWKNPF